MRAALVAIALLGCHRGAPAGALRVLDGFEDPAAWQASGSEGVQVSLSAVPGAHGRAMKLAFDLGATSGYAVAHRALDLDLSGEFELALELSGEAPPDNLEIKLLDATGQNVWWYHRADYAFPRDWRHVTIKRKQLEFAWGPSADHVLKRVAAIELAVSAGRGGSGGNRGWIAFDELTMRDVRPPDGPPPAASAAASSALPGGAAGLAIDGDPRTAWRSDPAATGTPQLTVDLGRARDFGGLILRWGARFATDYRLELSDDGQAWRAAGDVHGGNGGLDPFVLPETTARYVRLRITGGPGPGPSGGYELAELEVVELADAPSRDATTTAFVEALGKQLPRGSLPRAMSGEQPYWTVVGVDGGGGHASLMSEDGALELASGASVEPFVEIADQVTSWATAGAITQSLDDGYLPIPSVTWTAPGWELTITALAVGDPARHQLAARYTLHNRTAAPLTAKLVLAIRPLQVNPPRQFLNIAGGIRRIARIGFADGELSLDGALALRSETAPAQVSLWPFHALGYPLVPLARTPLTVVDPAELASGALGYALSPGPGASASVVITAPLAGDPAPPPDPAAAEAWFDAQLTQARAAWHAKLDRVGLHVPPAGEPLVQTLRSSLAYMLVSRDGAILRPGTRSYAKAWIRDGAMIGEALLRLGHPEVAAAFLRWYLPFQAASGRVPCCVEHGGAVPVPEHDSHGELIHLAA
ncbi:MAG TPA: discoidin domain-containing protein, partial [Kofleriaceae bacterium]